MDVLVYYFDDRDDAKCVAMARLLREKGMNPRLNVWPGATDLTLPAHEVELLQSLQRKQPKIFGDT